MTGTVTGVGPTPRLRGFGPAARTRHPIRTLSGQATPAAGFGRDAPLAARTHHPNRMRDPATPTADQRPGDFAGGTNVDKAVPAQVGQAMDRWLA